MRPLSLAALLAIASLSGCNRGDHPAQVGKKAADFTVSDGESTIQLSKYRGKIVLLNFWWSQCGPCIQEAPALLQLHRDFPNIEILGVSIDTDSGSYHRFLRRYGINYANVMDPDQKAAKMYHTDGWPETYIIDRQGVIRRKVVGDPDWSNPEIRGFLKSLEGPAASSSVAS
ncbi:MAG TPA: TlpA disulfide reductase family protein [Terracidiphilus sp.]|nr:TlpA disulfide reductase family protein [Terracidiphilus sp.]